MAGLVVDASVAMKWIVEEAGSESAIALRNENMIAPALVRIELAHVFRTLVAKRVLDVSVAEASFRFLQLAPLGIIEHDAWLERRALELGLELSHPVYDCLYLAVAERTDRVLITADRRFHRVVDRSRYRGLGSLLDQS